MNYRILAISSASALILIGCSIQPRPSEPPLPSVTSQQQTTQVTYYVTKATNTPQASTFGCGDILVPITIESARKDNTTLKISLNELFTNSNQYTDSQTEYSALNQANLTVDEVTESQSTVNVYLTGELILGGTCDNPRVEQQLTATIREYVPGKKINILINNIPLSDLLSEQ